MIRNLKAKSGFKQMLMSDDSERKDLETQNKVCSAIYDSEKTLGRLSPEAKREIAEAASVSIDAVNDVMHKTEHY